MICHELASDTYEIYVSLLLASDSLRRSPMYVKDGVSVLFYGTQLTISYFLMLAAMTYRYDAGHALC